MTSRRKMVLKPLTLTETLQCKEPKNLNGCNDRVRIQPPAALVSPSSDKKKDLLQEPTLVETSPAQRNKVLLSYSKNKNVSDTEDSDSDDSMSNDTPSDKSHKRNRKLYYKIFVFLCWAAVQYWMIAVAGFGAVFFACSALIAIYFNTRKTNKKSNTLSAYSVFNPQCTPIQGSADPKQLERELIFGGL